MRTTPDLPLPVPALHFLIRDLQASVRRLYSRCHPLFSSPLQGSAAFSSPRVLHARRALSGASWSTGAKLYQADRVGDAVPFLEKSAKLAEEVFRLWKSQLQVQNSASATQSQNEGEWKPFEAQLPGDGVRLAHALGRLG